MGRGTRTIARVKTATNCYEKGYQNNWKRKNRRRVVMGRGTRTIARVKTGTELL